MHSFFSGLGGSFIAAGIVFPMSEWTLDIEISEIDVTNFKSAGGWREFLNGFKSGRITAKGPFDPTGFDGVGMLPLGAPITLTCGIGGAYSFDCEAIITKSNFSLSIEGATMYSIEARVTGDIQANVTVIT